MHAHAHTTVWGTHTGIGRTTDPKGWFQQLKAWWATQKATRHDARLATLNARWDTTCEVVTPFRAEAASEMAATHHVLSVAITLYGLSR